MELHIKIIGFTLIALALFHGLFPRYFNWKTEFGLVSMINRQMMYVHTFFIGLILLLMGLLCLSSAAELTGSEFGRRVALGLGVFWSARLFIQFFGFSVRLWKGKSFETFIHIFFSVLWAYFSIVFVGVYRGWILFG